MNPDQIYYAITENRGVLKLTGTIRHPLSQRLSQAARRIFEGTDLRQVVVDLQEAYFIDSTCLGLLAQVALHSLELGLDPPILVTTQPEVTRTVRTTGLDRAFVLMDNPTEPATAMTSAEDLAEVSRRPDLKTVLEAHRTLCSLNENNKHLFQSVVESLEADLANESLMDPALHSPAPGQHLRSQPRR